MNSDRPGRVPTAILNILNAGAMLIECARYRWLVSERLAMMFSGERSVEEAGPQGLEVRFGRREFLEILHVENPSLVYRDGRVFFVFVAGLKVCTTDCSRTDFQGKYFILEWPDAIA